MHEANTRSETGSHIGRGGLTRLLAVFGHDALKVPIKVVNVVLSNRLSDAPSPRVQPLVTGSARGRIARCQTARPIEWSFRHAA